jgi:energy-coupling factor transport system substrate-specific component
MGRSTSGWRPGRMFDDWSTLDLVVAAVLAVAVGVVFWAWDLLWATAFQAVPFPVSYALVGVWMIGGLLVPYVIRRPGAALLGEMVAAFVSMVLINQWGAAVLLSGLVQGLGAELVFGARRWKDYRLPTVLLAGAVAGACSALLDSVVYSYWSQYTGVTIVAGVVFAGASGVLLGGAVSKMLGDSLLRTGVLSGLAISKERRASAAEGLR